MHHLEIVIEGPSYAKNVKGPQLRLMHDLQHLDSESLPGSCTLLQTGMFAESRAGRQHMRFADRPAQLGNDMMQRLPTVQCCMDSMSVHLQGSTSIVC